MQELYFDHFDEVSDQRKGAIKQPFVDKVARFMTKEPDFGSLAQIADYLKLVGENRMIGQQIISFTVMAKVMEGARRAQAIQKELLLFKSAASKKLVEKTDHGFSREEPLEEKD